LDGRCWGLFGLVVALSSKLNPWRSIRYLTMVKWISFHWKKNFTTFYTWENTGCPPPKLDTVWFHVT
jgi:hypothetical protein